MPLTKADILKLFELLNDEMAATDTKAELFLVGGAVMCLAYAARSSTQDVNAIFRPSKQVRAAAARVAGRVGMSPEWLNDGVKGFMGKSGDFAPFLEMDNLSVMVAQPCSQ